MIALGDYIPAPSPTRSPKWNKNSPTRSQKRTDQTKDGLKPIIFSDYITTDEDTENKENQPNSPNCIKKSPLKCLSKKNESNAEIDNAHSNNFRHSTNLKIIVDLVVNDDSNGFEKSELNVKSDDVIKKRIKEIQNVQPESLSEIIPVSSPNTIISKLRNGQRVKDGMILMLTGQVDKRKQLFLGAQVCQYDKNYILHCISDIIIY
jgi:hypothetical protein